MDWSDAPEGFLLQETGSLEPPVDWQISPLTPVLNNGVFSVSIPVSGSTPRLQKEPSYVPLFLQVASSLKFLGVASSF
jgi:hypothetical protein